MTYQGDFTLPSELLEQIAAQGFDVLPELIRIVINAAMQAERQQYLRAAPYQHSPDRRVIPTVTSQRRSRHDWAKSRWTFPRCGKAASTPKR
jgi:hypothetical protein